MSAPTLDSRQRALDLGYQYLGQRDRTVAEMRRYLEGKRVDPATIDEAVAELGEHGYLDDARYARQFAEDRRKLDDWGAERIERKLLSVGIATNLVEAALAARDAAAELDAAVDLLHRRFREPPVGDRERNRALGILVRKGYDFELAHDAIRAFARGD